MVTRITVNTYHAITGKCDDELITIGAGTQLTVSKPLDIRYEKFEVTVIIPATLHDGREVDLILPLEDSQLYRADPNRPDHVVPVRRLFPVPEEVGGVRINEWLHAVQIEDHDKRVKRVGAISFSQRGREHEVHYILLGLNNP